LSPRGGKNVAPQPIENHLKKNRFFDQPVLVGDRERFITLLVVPDFEALQGWATSVGLTGLDAHTLLEQPKVQEMLFWEMEREVADYARYEQPRKLVLLHEPFTIEDGSLTPTQKVKRRVVQARFAEFLTGVYDEARGEQNVFTLPRP